MNDSYHDTLALCLLFIEQHGSNRICKEQAVYHVTREDDSSFWLCSRESTRRIAYRLLEEKEHNSAKHHNWKSATQRRAWYGTTWRHFSPLKREMDSITVLQKDLITALRSQSDEMHQCDRYMVLQSLDMVIIKLLIIDNDVDHFARVSRRDLDALMDAATTPIGHFACK